MRQSQRKSNGSNQAYNYNGSYYKPPVCTLGAACTDPNCSMICRDPNCKDPNCSRNMPPSSLYSTAPNIPTIMPKLVNNACDNCGRSEIPLMKCSRCSLVSYCNLQCQTKAWENGHRYRCIPPSRPYSTFPPKEFSTEKPSCLKPSFSDLPHEGIDIDSVLKDLIQMNISKENNDDDKKTNGNAVVKSKKNKKNSDKKNSNTNADSIALNNQGHIGYLPENGCRYCKQSEFYPLIRTLVLGLSEQAGINYLQYKKLADKYYLQIPQNLQVAFMFECHRWATVRFGWSLVSTINAKEIIQLLVRKHPKCRRIVSMGSGCGYAEHMLYNASVALGNELKVHAFDLNSPRERANLDVEVKVGGVNSFEKLAPLDDAVLLLCWPPFGSRLEEQSRMGFDALSLFTKLGGRYFIYIGDFDSTGDWRFHKLLATEWQLYPETFDFTPMENWVPEKMALVNAGNDSIGIYHLKNASERK